MNLEEVKYAEEVSSIKTHKTFWFLVFTLIFIIIMASLFLIFTHKSSDKVSSKQLIEGASLDLGENGSVGFNFGNEEHGIKINFVGIDSAGVTIFSEPVSFVLELNEAKYLDMDDDGVYDIKVKLIGIENGIATITVQRMFVVLCDEKWNCSEWRKCSEGKQTRACIDMNECGTSEDKPSELRTCLKIELAENENSLENNANNSLNITDNTNDTMPKSLTNSTNANNLTNKTNIINSTNNTDINNVTNNTNIIVVNNKTSASNDTNVKNSTNSSTVLTN